jgi:hypothetical protein
MADQGEGSSEARAAGMDRGGASWALIAGLVLMALVLLLAVRGREPSSPRGLEAPPAEFSAARAGQVLRQLAADQRPHPLGSAAHGAMRQRVELAVRALGLEPKVEEGFACHPLGSCGQVENVLARIPGREPSSPGTAVVISAHYDSVGAGPGISDDLAGVAAVLEVARAIKAGPPLRHAVLLLLDDGEEAGLLGARAFLESSPEAAEAGADVNLEARGTAGPSLMFETSGASSWALPLFARQAPHPVTSSVFSTIYDYLPNDTDLTVFKRRRMAGLNFAFLDNPAYYHTPLDNLADASMASLQHQGESALAAVRALGDSTPPPVGTGGPPPQREIFFDLLGAAVVRWPDSAGLRLLELVLLVVVVFLTLVGLVRRGGVERGGGVGRGAFASGLAALPLAMVITVLVGFGLRFGLLAGAFPANWVAHPLPANLAFWTAALAGALGTAALLTRRAGTRGLWLGVWVWWALVGLALSGWLAPGVGYLFLVPAVVAGLVSGVVRPWRGGGREAAMGHLLVVTMAPALAAALLWFPILLGLYTGLGGGGLPLVGLLAAVLFLTLAPLAAAADRLVRRGLILAAAAVALVATVAAILSPPFSPRCPRPLPIVYHLDDATGQARWVVRGAPLPPELKNATPFTAATGPALPWSAPGRAFVAPAPPLPQGEAGPRLTVVEDTVREGKRHLRLRLTSPRAASAGAAMVYIPLAAHVEAARVNGHQVLPAMAGERAMRFPGSDWVYLADVTLPVEGCELEVELGELKPLDWYVADRTFGLPPGGETLQRARPATATTIQDGDVSIVSRRVRI